MPIEPYFESTIHNQNKSISSKIVSLNSNSGFLARDPYRVSAKLNRNLEYVVMYINEINLKDNGFIMTTSKDPIHTKVECCSAEIFDPLYVKSSYNFFKSDVQAAINKALLDQVTSNSNSNIVYVKMDLSSYNVLNYLDGTFKVMRLILRVGV
jgi:hypothetical protein